MNLKKHETTVTSSIYKKEKRKIVSVCFLIIHLTFFLPFDDPKRSTFLQGFVFFHFSFFVKH